MEVQTRKPHPSLQYHKSRIYEVLAYQWFWPRTITYRLVTPRMLLFCMAETTPALKRWDDMGAWMIWV